MAAWRRLALFSGLLAVPWARSHAAGGLLEQVRGNEAQIPEVGATRERVEPNLPASAFSQVVPNSKESPSGQPSAPEWDPELLRQVYTIAQEAIDRKLLRRQAREAYAKHALPALANGCVGVLRMAPGQLVASDMVYDTSLDAIKTPTLNLDDVQQRSVVVHELDHVVKDSLRTSQTREDSENGAYREQEEYKLRSEGSLKELPDGSVEIRLNRDASLLDSDMASAAVYANAIENIRKGKAALNGFWVGAFQFQGQSGKEVLEFLGTLLDNADKADRNAWRTATLLGGAAGSGVGPDTVLKRNGFARCAKL